MSDITQILDAVAKGNQQAARELFPLVYDELRHIASQKMMHEKPGQTLQPTALVHEAFLRLVRGSQETMANRQYFFAAAAEAMRRILVENARRKGRVKHGGQIHREQMAPDLAESSYTNEQLLALDAALSAMSKVYPVHAQLVELRYFGGCTNDEAAIALGISPSTADRRWSFARAWLQRELSSERNPE